MKKIVPIIIIIIFAIFMQNNEDKIKIPEKSIRFRIIANSNSIEDQKTKMLIVNDLSNSLFKDLDGIKDYKKANDIILNNNELINNTISKYTDNYSVSYGKNYFPKKEYLGTTYDEGEYDSLVINLDNSEGDNFWCVLFPPLCLLEAKDNNTKDVEYRSLVKDILDNM